ncbi:MAG: UDP-N-acetylmuramate dehydrogenase [Candidatus Kapaibacterium sp.]
MLIEKDKSLKNYNTFGVDYRAGFFVNIKYESQLQKLLETKEFSDSKRKLILGGGSNILFTGDFHGLIMNIDIQGMKIIRSDDKNILIETGAGNNWHKMVELFVRNGYHGLENLALIPGKAGAAPVQNIGAYGVEQSERFHSLTAFRLDSGETVQMTKDDCRFAYRNSVFKNEFKGKMIITKARYLLDRNFTPVKKYRDIQLELDKFNISEPDARYMFDTVSRIRRKKLPDWEVTGNAGSFFKNPVISSDKFNQLKELLPELISYPVEEPGMVKIPAAKLIESAGWKGKEHNKAAVSPGHALILINTGGASGRDIFELSQLITYSIKEKFGILLEPEVNII